MRIYPVLLLAAVAAQIAARPAFAADDIYIQVRTSQIRKSPQYWAPGLSSVKYGQALSVLEDAKDGWVKVRLGKAGAIGYVPLSAVSSSPVNAGNDLKRGAPNSKGPGDDAVVLAGKGLNAEVEKALAKSNSGMNFSAVNRVERLSVSSGELSQFAREGNLGGSKS